MTKIIPSMLKGHILPFNWDARKVWALDAEIIQVPRRDFDYLLELPLWSSVPKRGMLFDVSPIEVIRDPKRSPYQTQRLADIQIEHPLDFLLMHGRRWIIDGVHRLAKHYVLGTAKIAVRIHDESTIPKIRMG